MAPRAALTLILAAATVAGSVSCPSRPDPLGPDPRRRRIARPERVLRLRLRADLPKLSCILRNHAWCNRALLHTVYEPLLRWDVKTRRYAPMLARAWRQEQGGRLVHLELRKKVTWHNGKPFTARDVKHSLGRLARDFPRHPAARLLASHLRQVRYPTLHRVELHFDKPFGPLLEVLASLPMRPAPKTLGAAVGETPPPVGTGPYRYLQWWPGEKLVLLRHAKYWGPRPASHRLEFHVLPSLPEAWKRFKAGKLDLLLGLDAREYRQSLNALGAAASPFTVEPAAYAALIFNTQRPPYNDVRVRRAVAQLIDRSRLLVASAGGRPALLPQPIWRHGPQRAAAKGTLPARNAGLAKRELAAAGWKRQGGGPWTKGGEVLSLTVHTAQRSVSINRGLRALRGELKQQGVALYINVAIWGELVLAVKRRQHQAVVLAVDLGGPWHHLAGLLHSRAVAQGTNYAGFKHKALDALLDRLQEEIAPHRRLALERQAFGILAKERPLVPLHAPRILGLARGRIRDLKLNAYGPDLTRLRVGDR